MLNRCQHAPRELQRNGGGVGGEEGRATSPPTLHIHTHSAEDARVLFSHQRGGRAIGAARRRHYGTACLTSALLVQRIKHVQHSLQLSSAIMKMDFAQARVKMQRHVRL